MSQNEKSRKLMRHFTRLPGLAALSLALVAAGASAAYPERSITLIVPFAPGASADGIARVVAQELSNAVGQPVVVENRPGAGGATGLMAVARAEPDGYTLGMGATGALVVAPHLPDSSPLKPDEQLQPLAKLADIPLVLVAGKASGFDNLKDVLAKGKQTEIPTGNTGQYTAQHLSAELLANMAGIKLYSVPYRGSAPAVTDLLGGQVPLALVDFTSAAPHISAGTIKPMAVTSSARSKLAPDIPTMAEAGVPGYGAHAWMGLFLPKGASPEVVAKLSKEIAAVMEKPEVQQRIIQLSAEPSYMGPEDFGRFIANESNNWRSVIQKLNTAGK